MLIPGGERERLGFYLNVVREASRSQADRRFRFRRNRTLYLNGTDTGEKARFNKLGENIRSSSAYLYNPESARFGIDWGPERDPDTWLEEAEVLRRTIQFMWHDAESSPSLTFAMGVTQAHYAETAIFKVVAERNKPLLCLIPDPTDVCVWQEGVHEWHRQQAIVHWYDIDLESYRRLVTAGVPQESMRERRDTLLRAGEDYAGPGQQQEAATLPANVQNILVAAVTPNMIGVPRMNSAAIRALPRDGAPVVRLCELWIWDDEITEYRVATLLEPAHLLLWDPRNTTDPGHHAFHPLCISPTDGYIWGTAPIEDLEGLQEWRTLRQTQIDRLRSLQLKPPKVAIGVSGIAEEKLSRLDEPGGEFANPLPSSDVKPWVVSGPPDPYEDIRQIDKDFANQAGLPLPMTGQGDPGVRSGGQELMRATLGGGPTITRAMLVERAVERVATALLRLKRMTSGEAVRKPANGQSLLLSQTPKGFAVKVTAHSASPVYQQELMVKVGFAAQQQWLDADDGIELLGLPNTPALSAKARRRQKAAGEAAKQVQENYNRETDVKVADAETKRIAAVKKSVTA